MGTVSYMSPEQAAGRKIDYRSDQFSFGLILYEMLTGKLAFRRETKGETLAAILRDEPHPVSELNPAVPAPLRWIVERCLAKDPEERYASTRDLSRDLATLGDRLSEPSGALEAVPIPSRPLRRRWLTMSVLAVLLLVVTDLALRLHRPPGSDRRTVQFEIGIPADSSLSLWIAPLALSPDGGRLVFSLDSLWLRPLDSLEARPLPRTDGAHYPFWSADGRSVGFVRHGQLQILDLKADSVPQTLCVAPAGVTHGSWSREGIVLLGSLGNPIYRISSAGGGLTAVTRLDASRAETAHLFPHFLPDGRHFLYLARSSKPGLSGVYVGSLDGGSPKRLLTADSNASFAPPGFLLFGREGTLLRQPFDADRLALTGAADPVVGKVSFDTGGQGGMAFSVSQTGVLAYALIVTQPSQLEWFDRRGRKLGVVGTPGLHLDVDLAPDGRRAVVETMDPETGKGNLWLHDLARGINSRFSHDPTWSFHPLWSPDGKSIVFCSTRAGGATTLFVKSADGGRDEEPLSGSFIRGWPTGFSHDGRSLVTMLGSTNTGTDIFVVPLDGHFKPTPFLATEFSEAEGTLSHDDRWIAYTSDESGRREVYVRPFPTGDGKWQISADGGTEPRWRADGRELFFLSADGHLMAVDIPKSAAFDSARPVPLFATHARRHINRNDYAVSADGSRFLVNNLLSGDARSRIVVVLNWQQKEAP
jgi:eukaryotic-like serine/threonine-protein kinase